MLSSPKKASLGKGSKNQFCGARTKTFTFYSWTPDLGNTLVGRHKILIESSGNLSGSEEEYSRLKSKQWRRLCTSSSSLNGTQEHCELLGKEGRPSSLVFVQQLEVRSLGLERYIINKYKEINIVHNDSQVFRVSQNSFANGQTGVHISGIPPSSRRADARCGCAWRK